MWCFHSPTAFRFWSMARCWSKVRPARWRAMPASRQSISAREPMPDLLCIEGLRAGYGEAVVLPGMSLRLAESQVLALLGRNGTGKTTLINSIVGITRRFGGTVILGGLDITRAGGPCSIMVEQNAQKVVGLADRVVILERGAIVHDAASAALKADPAVLERFLGVSGAAPHSLF